VFYESIISGVISSSIVVVFAPAIMWLIFRSKMTTSQQLSYDSANNLYIKYIRKTITKSSIKKNHKSIVKNLQSITTQFKNIILRTTQKEIKTNYSYYESIMFSYTQIIALAKYAIEKEVYTKDELTIAKDTICKSIEIQDLLRSRLNIFLNAHLQTLSI